MKTVPRKQRKGRDWRFEIVLLEYQALKIADSIQALHAQTQALHEQTKALHRELRTMREQAAEELDA